MSLKYLMLLIYSQPCCKTILLKYRKCNKLRISKTMLTLHIVKPKYERERTILVTYQSKNLYCNIGL